MNDHDRTASLMSPAKLARMRPKAAASPGAWLDQMAADVGLLQVDNLVGVQRALESQAGGRDLATVRGALEALQTVQQQLDFSLLQTRGWWARTTGKARSAGAEFAAQVEQITEATRALGTLASLLQKSQPGESAVTERTLVDMEVEYRALDQLVEQGAKWLQDMRTQLQQRHAAAAADPAAQQQVREDAARCEILVTRLKALRAISAMARATLNQTREVLALRAALALHLSHAMPATFRGWSTRLTALANAAADVAGGPELSVEAPMEIHQQMQQQTADAVARSAQLLALEQALATSLGSLGRMLADARGA